MTREGGYSGGFSLQHRSAENTRSEATPQTTAAGLPLQLQGETSHRNLHWRKNCYLTDRRQDKRRRKTYQRKGGSLVKPLCPVRPLLHLSLGMAGCTSRCRQGVLKLIQSLQRLVSGGLTKEGREWRRKAGAARAGFHGDNMGAVVGTLTMQTKQRRPSRDRTDDELEMTTVCYRPEGLSQLEAQTNFSKQELQILYRGFKNECPSGVVNEETFKHIYAQFFPHGDVSMYAHYLFNAFDTTNNGSIKFKDFVMGLSILLRGTLREKLEWTFHLYDINKDGYINREKMDKNKDGVVTLEEFIIACQEDETMMSSMQLFENVIKAGAARVSVWKEKSEIQENQLKGERESTGAKPLDSERWSQTGKQQADTNRETNRGLSLCGLFDQAGFHGDNMGAVVGTLTMQTKQRRPSRDRTDDELEMTTVCYRPEGLSQLEAQTNFSKQELQILYRGFKNECPSGVVNEETFKHIYAQFFPHGDVSMYAHYLFNAFDTTNNGSIKFKDFVMGLSILLRGTLREKLEWTFHLYDINKDGYINREEMTEIVRAIYDMMGKFTYPAIKGDVPQQHVDAFFRKMDKNKDGVVTLEEFIIACQE
ncbi:hypothetical protein F7725_007226, partial [Dissostichus mawsoni]